MKRIASTVTRGYGVATQNLSHVMGLIETRMGLAPLVPGTLNLRIPEAYVVVADSQISREEYNGLEYIKLQRCRLGKVRAVIMRPNTHEDGHAHGPAHLELLSTVVLRDHFALKDGDVLAVELEGDDNWWNAVGA